MPLTLACVNPKGGSGKTTIAIHLAVASHRSGYPTKLVDADPQGTALDWSRRTPDGYDGPAVEHVSTDDSLAPYIGGADIVVIDSPARLDERTGAVLSVSDLALIPVRPSGLDLWGTKEFLEVLDNHLTNGLKAAFVASQRDVRTTLSDELEDVLSQQDLHSSTGLRPAWPMHAASQRVRQSLMDTTIPPHGKSECYSRTSAQSFREYA